MTDDPTDESENQSQGRGRPTVRIPTHWRASEPIRWKPVDKEWYDLMRAAKRARKELADQFMEEPGIETVTIRNGTKAVGGQHVPVIAFTVTEEADVSNITSEKDGITIQLRDADDYQFHKT